jgi:ZIP family zinc transporter
MPAIVNVFFLSLVAGLGTGLGGLLAIVRIPGERLFGYLMGLAAGVMISLSFLELVNQAWEMQGFVTATVGFGLGAVFMLFMDMLIPHIRFGEREVRDSERDAWQLSRSPSQADTLMPDRSHHPGQPHRKRRHQRHSLDQKLFNSGMLIAFGITVHNIPEGIAVGAAYMHQPRFGFFIALAIMLHNIPEGIASALPLLKSGVRRWESFRVALFSGLVEPIGAVLAALFLVSFQSLIPGALAFAGGVMTFITLDELIPAAREYGHQHFTALGIITGSIFVFLLSGLFGV